jgi:hypothetical protein
MICAGIPVLRPLYRRITGSLTTASKSGSSSAGYYKHGTGNDTRSTNIDLPDLSSQQDKSSGLRGGNSEFPESNPKLGLRGVTTVTYIKGDNHSDEEILGWECRRESGIQVREHVDVRVEQAERKENRSREQDQRDGESVEEMV